MIAFLRSIFFMIIYNFILNFMNKCYIFLKLSIKLDRKIEHTFVTSKNSLCYFNFHLLTLIFHGEMITFKTFFKISVFHPEKIKKKLFTLYLKNEKTNYKN